MEASLVVLVVVALVVAVLGYGILAKPDWAHRWDTTVIRMRDERRARRRKRRAGGGAG